MELMPIFIIGFIGLVGLWILFIILYEKPRKKDGSAPHSETSPLEEGTPPQYQTGIISDPGVLGNRYVAYHEFKSRKKALPASFWRASIIVFLAYVAVVVGYCFWTSWPTFLFSLILALLAALIAGIKKWVNRVSMTPLMKAASKGDVQKCRRLVEQGAKINAGSRFGDTPLIFACVGSRLETVQFLLNQGASVKVRGTDQQTALMVAARQKESSEQIEILNHLIEKGAEIDGADKYQMTALMYAVEAGNTSAVRFLIDQGADVNKERIIKERSEDNEGAHHVSYVHRTPLSMVNPESKGIREMLVAAGAQESFDEQIGRI